ncbi:hypothetical protein GE061_003660 [Apolygus lucorum]|uniref:Uncharacterized protein n=1 Tax=Apolygus lucorum TaxID=248454 RepID=A0A8S9X2N5_APOLU|nr:hypothetical protein GE061_003660 [Apolygus lucorum]
MSLLRMAVASELAMKFIVDTKWMLKEEDKTAFSILLWTTTGVKPLTNVKLPDCKAGNIEAAVNHVVTYNTPSCAYVRG